MFWLIFKLLILPALCVLVILIASGAILLTGTSEPLAGFQCQKCARPSDLVHWPKCRACGHVQTEPHVRK